MWQKNNIQPTHDAGTIGNTESAEAPAVARDYRRNITAFVLFEFLWGLGMPFASYMTMVPGYMAAIGTSKSLIGFVQSFWTIFTPLQLVSSYFFQRKHRARNIILLHVMAVLSWVAYDCLALFTPMGQSQAFLTVGIVCALFCFVGFINLATPHYIGALTDNVPMKKRGNLFGLRTLGFGSSAIIMSVAVKAIFERWPSPINFQFGFLIGNGIYLAACIAPLLLRDHPVEKHGLKPASLVKDLLGNFRRLWHNPSYRVFLFFHLLVTCATIIGSFVVPFASETLSLTTAQARNGLYWFEIGTKKATVTLCSEYTDRQWPFELLWIVADRISVSPCWGSEVGAIISRIRWQCKVFVE